MKILLLSDWMSNRGGAESYIVSLKEELRASGDEVLLLSCGSSAADSTGSDIRAFGSDMAAAQVFLQVVNPFAVSRVKSAVREFRPDVAMVSQFAYHMSPAILPALRPVPTAVTMMDYKAFCPTGTRLLPNGSRCAIRPGIACHRHGCVGLAHWLRDRPRYSSMRTGLRGARQVMCPSDSMRKDLSEAGIEAVTIPLGVRAYETGAGEPSRHPTFAYVGRFSREKGVAVLLAAFARILPQFPGAKLRLIGDGPLRGDLAALARALGILDSVEFRGWCPPERLGEVLGDAWCVVCPSIWAEPFGMAAVEANLLGIPVVASDTGGFLETIEEGLNGILFRTGDVSSLTEKLRSIATGATFPAKRLSRQTVAGTRARFEMKVHATRVREVLAAITESPSH